MDVQMPLRILLPFLEGAVRLLVEQARNAAVVRSLRRSENLQIREDLTKSKQRCILVPASIIWDCQSSISVKCCFSQAEAVGMLWHFALRHSCHDISLCHIHSHLFATLEHAR